MSGFKKVEFDLSEAIALWLEASGYPVDDFKYLFEDRRGVPIDILTEVVVSVGPSRNEENGSATVPQEVTARCVCAIVDGTCAQCLRAAARGDDMGDL